jgi:hypothetical protein
VMRMLGGCFRPSGVPFVRRKEDSVHYDML